MGNNKVDGLKKLSKDELEKSRKIVLDSIIEHEKNDKPAKEKLSVKTKKVDGIFSFRDKGESRKLKAKETKKEPKKIPEKDIKMNLFGKLKTRKNIVKKGIDSIEKSNDISKFSRASEEKNQKKEMPKIAVPAVSQEEKSKLRQEVNKAIKIEKSEKSEFGLTPALFKTMKNKEVEEKKLRQKIIKKDLKEQDVEIAADFLKSEQELEKREDKKLERKNKKIKKIAGRKELKLKKKQERDLRQKKKEVNQKNRLKEKLKYKKDKQERKQKRIINLKAGFNKLLLGFLSGIKITLSRALKIALLSLTALVLFYTIFAVILLKFNLDNGAARFISKYFVVPAIITKNGVIEYYTYRDIENIILTNVNNKDRESIKLATVRTVVFSDLAKKYGITIQGSDIYSEELKIQMIKRIMVDGDVNQVGIKRIKKIKEMFDKGSDFIKTSNKYGDTQGLVTIDNQNESQIAYSTKVKDLNVDDISSIIYMPEGYYIFRCYGKSDDSIDLSYVFVKAKSLDDYINETVKGYKIWSLAK